MHETRMCRTDGSGVRPPRLVHENDGLQDGTDRESPGAAVHENSGCAGMNGSTSTITVITSARVFERRRRGITRIKIRSACQSRF